MPEVLIILQYVMGAAFFWPSMGVTTAIAMLIGATLYDGELAQVNKAIVSITSYAIMLLITIIARINETTATGVAQEHLPMVYAGVTTVFLITFFWVLGLFFGVLLLKYKNRNKKKK
jgi:hypothetical protein